MRRILALLCTILSTPLSAQTLATPALVTPVVITSDVAENVTMTVYRDPERGQQPIDRDWPSGYALITETRTVSIPAGESVIRFEGVSEGMFPETAIVTNLPGGVREKNRDARLLSPAGLVDAYLKRAVTLIRTDKATGATKQQDAIIVTGPGGLIIQTTEGYEAMNCTGLPERISYGGVPTDLSAKPTLSIITTSDQAVTATLTLTYMAGGFDWDANYLLNMDGKTTLDKQDKGSLFAWLTVANGGNQSFANASLMAVAGKPNREDRDEEPRPTGQGLTLRCWPMQRTHEVPFRGMQSWDAVYAPAPMAYDEGDDIIVTAQRSKKSYMQETGASVSAVMTAELENLGDLKLYRIPERVNVNAMGQKQVAMITQPKVRFERFYTANANNYDSNSRPMTITLRNENLEKNGMGLPLPAGQVQVFENSNFGPLLAGESSLDDRAVGDKVEIDVGESPDVQMKHTLISEKQNDRGEIQMSDWRLEISNAGNQAVPAEIKIPYELNDFVKIPKGVNQIDGVPTWRVTIPANGNITLDYSVK